MGQVRIWIFRVLFFLAVLFHVWVLYSFGGDYVVFEDSFFWFLAANIPNWSVQFGLPIWFFWEGWLRK